MSRISSRQRHRALSSLPMAAMAASRGKAILLAAVLLSTMAGCGASAPELDANTAKALQAQVLAVTEAAAANDPAGSLKLLDELATTLDQAAAGGSVSATRHQSIRTAIDAVRADLNAGQAAAEAARVAAEQAAATEAARVAAEQAAAAEAARVAAEQAAAEQAAAATAAAPPPAVIAPAPVPAENDKDKGKGQDVGKGQGKG